MSSIGHPAAISNAEQIPFHGCLNSYSGKLKIYKCATCHTSTPNGSYSKLLHISYRKLFDEMPQLGFILIAQNVNPQLDDQMLRVTRYRADSFAISR